MRIMDRLSESDTRAKLIDPALHMRGWTEDLIRREETDCGLEALKILGEPKDIINETKKRLFAA